MPLRCICPVNFHSGKPYFARTSFTSLVEWISIPPKPKLIRVPSSEEVPQTVDPSLEILSPEVVLNHQGWD